MWIAGLLPECSISGRITIQINCEVMCWVLGTIRLYLRDSDTTLKSIAADIVVM
jgi:hypothetical protein